MRTLKDFEKCTIAATDGDIGHTEDLYFDDHTWVVRYFIVDTGSWLAGRKVRISPISVQKPDWSAHKLAATITREQVEGFLIDDEGWAIRYLVVNTSNWWLGHKVLIAPQWISGVHRSVQTVSVDLSREAVKAAPTCDPSDDLDRQREEGLYRTTVDSRTGRPNRRSRTRFDARAAGRAVTRPSLPTRCACAGATPKAGVGSHGTIAGARRSTGSRFIEPPPASWVRSGPGMASPVRPSPSAKSTMAASR